MGRGGQPGPAGADPGVDAAGRVVASGQVPADWVRSAGSVLATCGFPGEVVARSPAQWASTDGSDELELAVLVERRALWGTPVDPLPVVDDGARETILASLARRALGSAPPTGFDGDAVLEADGTRSARLDIRRAAIVPIVELARWGSGAVGVVEGSTTERLRAAADGGVLRDEDARTLADAFELGLELRIDHHMERLAEGRAAGRPARLRPDQPAAARSPPRRVPRGERRAGEAARVRLAGPRRVPPPRSPARRVRPTAWAGGRPAGARSTSR